jgi:urease accessory protein
MHQFKSNSAISKLGLLAAVSGATWLIAAPAYAHHPLGGKLPSNFFEGFMSGLAHPIIGPDHFAFIVAVGLLAVLKRQGLLIPVAFVLAAMAGAGGHLAGLNLPGVELLVAGSIVIGGLLLTLKQTPKMPVVAGLMAIAGLFHGYAYGEAIFGAEMTPVVAYLAGFTLIQLGVAIAAYWIGNQFVNRAAEPSMLRYAGLVVLGVGLAFLTSQVASLMFPA